MKSHLQPIVTPARQPGTGQTPATHPPTRRRVNRGAVGIIAALALFWMAVAVLVALAR